MNDDERTKMCGAYPIYPNVTRMELLVFDRYFSLFLFITGVAYIITSLVRFLYYKKVGCPLLLLWPITATAINTSGNVHDIAL